MPPVPGNTNGVRHGARTARHGMVLPNLGRKYRHVEGHARALRKTLESQVIGTHGALTPVLTGEISLAVRYEVTAQVSMFLVARGDNLPASEVASLLKTATWATAERNRCIARLKLAGKGDDATDPWAALELDRQNSALPRQNASEAVQSDAGCLDGPAVATTPANAPASTPENVEGQQEGRSNLEGFL